MSDQLSVLRDRLATRFGGAQTPANVAAAMREVGLVVSDETVLDTIGELRRNSLGAGVLDDLLKMPGVTDVLVNGPKDVFIDSGDGLRRVQVSFGDDEQVRRLATRLASGAGRRLDDAQPFVDARLADGTRLHAVLAPISEPGTCISLRVPAKSTFSLDDLVASGSIPPAGAKLLSKIVSAKLAFLVSGGTGSGKTTLLSALLGEVEAAERILIVEDSRELQPNCPHCVRMESKPANAEGIGAITLTQLVRQALRMRPDRLVLGEVRGAEICDLLTALNTGHEGGCGTVHANSILDIPARLEALAALGGMSREACHAQVGSALHVAVHVRRTTFGRKVEGVGVFERVPGGEVVVENAATFGADIDWGPAGDKLKALL